VALGFGFGELREHVGREVDLIAAAVLVLALFGPLAVRRFVARSRST
jgi:hypothetical protein